MKPKSLAEILQSELQKRRRKNARYSMRAFAKFLDIDFSTLAKVMKNRRNLGRSATTRIAERLLLPKEEVNRLVVEAQYPLAADSMYATIEHATFKSIADWEHFAILELMTTTDFRADPDWIAKRLRISVDSAYLAVENLQSAGFIAVDTEGRWIDKSSFHTTVLRESESVNARRSYMSQTLGKAQEALETLPLADQKQKALTMAIDKTKLEEAKARINRFSRELAELLTSGDGPKTEVYSLAIALCPITHSTSDDASS